MAQIVSVIVSQYARDRHLKGASTGLSYFQGTELELVGVVRESLDESEPLPGYRDGIVRVVVAPDRFRSALVEVSEGDGLAAVCEKRRGMPDNEVPRINVLAEKEPGPAGYVEVILYSHSVLLEGNEHSPESTEEDWEVISINAWPTVGSAPMEPTTMARNHLGMPGGTRAQFTADEFAQAVWFWSNHTMCKPASDSPFSVRNGAMTVSLGDGRVAIGDPKKGLTFSECDPHQIGAHVEKASSEPRLTISVPEGEAGMSALRTLMRVVGSILRKRWLEANCPSVPEVELHCILCGATLEDVTKENGQMFQGHVAVCSGCIDFCHSKKEVK